MDIDNFLKLVKGGNLTEALHCVNEEEAPKHIRPEIGKSGTDTLKKIHEKLTELYELAGSKIPDAKDIFEDLFYLIGAIEEQHHHLTSKLPKD